MFRSKKENEQEKKSRLEGLQERLYSKNNPTLFRDKRSGFHSTGDMPSETWQDIEETNTAPIVVQSEEPHTLSRVAHVILYGALAVLVGAIGFTFYHFFYTANRPVPEKIAVEINAPSFINGGELFPIDVNITNLNKVAIQKVDLVVEYPKGESITEQSSADRVRIPIGDIAPGAIGRGTTDIVLYGRESNVRDIKISLEYYAPGSYVILRKELTHSLVLKAAPVVLTTEHLKEISSNQEITYTVHIKAERGIDLKNFLLNVEYPNGFQFIGAEPSPKYSNNVWGFDSIEKGTAKDVVIRGVMRGEDGDEKVFRVSGGSPDLLDTSKVGIVYADTRSFVVVQKPFISLTGAFDSVQNNSGEFAIKGGEGTSGAFTYQNNIGDTISNVIVSAKISGEILDRRRVTVVGGYYDSSTNTLVWNRTTTPELASLLPGASGVLRFKIQTYPLTAKQNGYFSQPTVTVEARVLGKRLSDTSVPEVSAASRPLVGRVITEAGLRAQVLPENGGAATDISAPVHEKQNIYTLSISVLNRSNQLTASKINIILDPHVTLVPDQNIEGVSYDKNTNTIIWQAGLVLPDTGFGRPAKTLNIKVSVVPSIADVGTKQTIADSVTLSGQDDHSGVTISSQAGKIELSKNTQ